MKTDRLKLPTNLPPRSSHFNQFAELLKRINNFYWTTRISLQHVQATSTGYQRLSDFTPDGISKKYDISVSDFNSSIKEVEHVARFMMLVQASAAWEDYIKSSIRQMILQNPKKTKTYTIKVQLEELGKFPSTDSGILEIIAETEAKRISNERYDKQWNQIKNLVDEFVGKGSLTWNDSKRYAFAAMEARNCIAHSSGYADDRAVEGLSFIFPHLSVGQLLPITELWLWRMLGGLKDSAHALDVALRQINRTSRDKRVYKRQAAKSPLKS